MAEINAAMTGGSFASQKATESMQNSRNQIGSVVLQADPYANRVPEYYVGIFNVSKKELRVARPWGKGGRTTLGDTAREVIIPARDEDALYSKPYILRDIEPITRTFVGSDELSYIPTSGEFLAQDLVNSNDPKGSWRTYRPINPATSICEGNNYYDRGIFWCRLDAPDSEPDMEAVEAAIGHLEDYYNRLVNEARQLWSGDPKDRKFIGRPHHDAAEYFALDEPWHMQMTGGLRSKLAAAKKQVATPPTPTQQGLQQGPIIK